MRPEDQAIQTWDWLVGECGASDEFADAVVGRITTAGTEYYFAPTNTMLFETMARDKVFVYAEEEALDIGAYAFMIARRASTDPVRGVVAQAIAEVAYDLWDTIRDARKFDGRSEGWSYPTERQEAAADALELFSTISAERRRARIIAFPEDTTASGVDITEDVVSILDVVVGTIDWGSGFFDDEELEGFMRICDLLKVDVS